jgi:hypothetical protein
MEKEMRLNQIQRDRGNINMDDDYEARYWGKHLGLTRHELQQVIDRVGNSVKAVEKELGIHNANT